MAGKGKKTAIILKASVERSKTFQESGLTEYVLAVHPPAGERVRGLFKKFRPLMNPKLILQFLLSDKSFPRSIRFNLSHVRKAIMNWKVRECLIIHGGNT